MRWFTLAQALILQSGLPTVTALDVPFLPFGTSAGDTMIAKALDGSSGAVDLSLTFPFFGQSFSRLWISTNGLISFTESDTHYIPIDFPRHSSKPPVVAPFWADANIQDHGEISYREATEAATLAQAQAIVDAYGSIYGEFHPEMVFVVTWNGVAGYLINDPTVYNTFQCLLMTDGSNALVAFLYDHIGWPGVSGNIAQVGFDAGDGERFYSIPEARTMDVLNLPMVSNVDCPGLFIFRVDGSSIQANEVPVCECASFLNGASPFIGPREHLCFQEGQGCYPLQTGGSQNGDCHSYGGPSSKCRGPVALPACECTRFDHGASPANDLLCFQQDHCYPMRNGACEGNRGMCKGPVSLSVPPCECTHFNNGASPDSEYLCFEQNAQGQCYPVNNWQCDGNREICKGPVAVAPCECTSLNNGAWPLSEYLCVNEHAQEQGCYPTQGDGGCGGHKMCKGPLNLPACNGDYSRNGVSTEDFLACSRDQAQNPELRPEWECSGGRGEVCINCNISICLEDPSYPDPNCMPKGQWRCCMSAAKCEDDMSPEECFAWKKTECDEVGIPMLCDVAHCDEAVDEADCKATQRMQCCVRQALDCQVCTGLACHACWEEKREECCAILGIENDGTCDALVLHEVVVSQVMNGNFELGTVGQVPDGWSQYDQLPVGLLASESRTSDPGGMEGAAPK